MATKYSFELSARRYCGHRHHTIGAMVDCAIKLCGDYAGTILPKQYVATEKTGEYRPLDPDENFVLTLALEDRNLM